MLDPMKQHGVFSWNELLTSDIDGAKAFYSKLFGWTLEDVKPGEADYTLAKIDGQNVAGMMRKPPEMAQAPSLWGAYVTVDDVEESRNLAESLGAKIVVEPTDIPGIGRFCVIVDPQGAALSMITYVDKPMS